MRRAWCVVAAVALAGCGEEVAPAVDAGVRDGGAVDAAPGDAGTPDAGTTEDVPPPIAYGGPDDWCPGREHCRPTGDGRLRVGVARELINPDIVEREWTDTNRNNAYDMGEAFVDVNGNGSFDATWVAGFGNGRPAVGSHDDLEVRAIAFRYNDTTVALAVLDCVGYFINHMDQVRAEPALQGVDVDRVIIASTHDHEGVDTVGLWGPRAAVSGLNPAYMALVRQRTALAVRRAVEAVRPARMRVAQVLTVDPTTGSTMAYVNDTRDPVLFDPTVTVAQFVDDADPTRTIGAWVNWSSHPEYGGSRNNLLSADYVHALRQTIEEGVAADSLPGLGGVAVFQNGALGGQVGPGGGVAPRGADGMPIAESGLPKAMAAGRNVGALALRALASDGVEASVTAVSYRTAPIHCRTENTLYGILYSQRTIERELFNYNERRAIGAGNYPWVRSRVTYLQVGPVAMISAPGELHPELWIGTDPRWSWGRPTLTETVNRPDLTMGPPAPYLRDLMLMNPDVRYAFVGGLTEDFLGYIVPAYNFVVNPIVPYLAEAMGQHYEETNSVGPEVERYLNGPMRELARWRPPAD